MVIVGQYQSHWHHVCILWADKQFIDSIAFGQTIIDGITLPRYSNIRQWIGVARTGQGSPKATTCTRVRRLITAVRAKLQHSAIKAGTQPMMGIASTQHQERGLPM
jgi:hypothetical protein